jgi:isoleucyl-tRNA synthetase
VLARVFKDIFPRYRTMCGYYVERKGGWDCHGLPVELAVEAELGMTSKEDIEEYGIAEFNARCRQKVLSHVEDWIRLTERIGFWVDTDDAYKTLDPSYVESVWWALKTIYEKGLLYEKLKVVPYCPRCGTALSSHELGQPGVYQDVVDPSVYVILPVPSARASSSCWSGRRRPWTLVSNAAVAVDPELTYVRAPGDGRVIVAEALASGCFGPRAPRSLERFPGGAGRRLVRAAVRLHPGREYGPRATRCCRRLRHRHDGTGLVHTAIAFGEDDFRLGEQNGLTVDQPGAARRHLRRADRPLRGPQRVKDADADLIEDLRARPAAEGRALRALLPALLALRDAAALLRQAVLVHRHQPDQGPAAGRQRDGQLAAAARQARALRQVARGQRRLGAVARALLGHAAAGLALLEQAPARDRLARRAARALRRRARGPAPPVRRRRHLRLRAELRRPMQRVPEVIDVWFDSGSMPFAQYGAPHAGTERVRGALPRRLHLRGARPDPRLVLLAARRLDAAVRPLARTATSSASA